jgi:glycerophosphoryl diester phosphodiesterase
MSRALIVSGLAALAFAGTPDDLPAPEIVAHRGASHLAPENTIPAFELAWEQDADTIEADFHLSKDGVVVAHHDKSTKKTARVDRLVAEQTLEELRQHDVGLWKGRQWIDTRIPTMAEVLATVPEDGRILIELKGDQRILEPLARILETQPIPFDRLTIICFKADAIAWCKQRLPAIDAYWLTDFDDDEDGGWTPTLEEIIETATRIGADGVDVQARADIVDADFVRALHAQRLDVHVWTVNDVGLARRMAYAGVDGITTDRPGWLRERLRRTDWRSYDPDGPTPEAAPKRSAE